MLGALIDVAMNFKRLDVHKITRQSLDSTQLQQDIISLNTEDQLYDKGVFADGSPTGKYAANTIEGTKYYLGKKQKGQPYNHITFKDTGELYESIRFNNKAKEFELVGNTVKDGVDLEDRYGNPLIGLTDDSLGEVSDYIFPIIKEITLNEILK